MLRISIKGTMTNIITILSPATIMRCPMTKGMVSTTLAPSGNNHLKSTRHLKNTSEISLIFNMTGFRTKITIPTKWVITLVTIPPKK